MKIWPKLWKFDQNYGNLIKKNRLRDHGNLTKNYENLTKIMLIWSKLLKFDQIIRFMYLTGATAELTASDIPWGILYNKHIFNI